MKLLVTLCFCLTMLAGCAGNMPARSKESDREQAFLSRAGDPIERFMMAGGIKEMGAISDNFLFVRTSRGEAYLIRTWACPNLDDTRRIRIDSASSNIVRRTDKIIVAGDTCQIREIRPIK